MEKKQFNLINDIYYDLQLEKVIQEINKSKASLVLLQFPDGLKRYAVDIVDYLRKESEGKVEFFIWLGNCFGACDTPVLSEELKEKIDLVIQFGHNELMPGY